MVAHTWRYVVTAREDVLARIRDAIGSGAAPVNVPRAYRTAGAHDPGDAALLDLLQDRLVDYRATVHRTGESGIAGVVARVLADRGARRIAKAPGLHLELGSDITLLTDDEARSIAMLDSVDGVITGCAVAIAETGTIVLDASPVCGHRALTLVPDFYVAIVRGEQVVESVSEALSALDPRAALTWVSGPSATSDIELSRVEGVHGPRTLVVVLVS